MNAKLVERRGMAAPAWIRPHLGYRRRSGPPNISDSANAPSVAISREMFHLAGITRGTLASPTRSFEDDVARSLRTGVRRLARASPQARALTFRTEAPVSRYAQYEHLSRLQRLIEADPSDLLGVEIGRDYEISADIVVERAPAARTPLARTIVKDLLATWPDEALGSPPILTAPDLSLHAVVSLKWTIRSDRVQNVRHEAVTMIRHRRGRLPHIAVVTLEPLPGRLAAIARGTGEVDAVYHLMFDELWQAVRDSGTKYQVDTLRELVAQRRVLPWSWLAPAIASD